MSWRPIAEFLKTNCIPDACIEVAIGEDFFHPRAPVRYVWMGCRWESYDGVLCRWIPMPDPSHFRLRDGVEISRTAKVPVAPKLSDDRVREWRDRHGIYAGVSEARAMIEDAQSLPS